MGRVLQYGCKKSSPGIRPWIVHPHRWPRKNTLWPRRATQTSVLRRDPTPKGRKSRLSKTPAGRPFCNFAVTSSSSRIWAKDGQNGRQVRCSALGIHPEIWPSILFVAFTIIKPGGHHEKSCDSWKIRSRTRQLANLGEMSFHYCF